MGGNSNPEMVSEVSSAVCAPSAFAKVIAENKEAADWYESRHGFWADRNAPDTTLPQLTAYFEKMGFHDLEYLGKGSEAMVIAPKDNPDIVFRICSGRNNRKVNPYLLQPIGSEILQLGNECYTIDTIKRVDIIDLNRSSPNYSDALLQDYLAFCKEAQEHGNRIGSMGRGREIGYYTYATADGTFKTVIMGIDPSCLNAEDSTAHAPHHPSLVDQARENLRLAKMDSRLAEFMVPLEADIARLTAKEKAQAPGATVVESNATPVDLALAKTGQAL